MNALAIMIRKHRKILVPVGVPVRYDSRAMVLTMARNLKSLGFLFSRELADALATQAPSDVAESYATLVEELKTLKGAHEDYRPMYPNFPEQMARMDDIDLYWNAVFHYLTLEDPNAETKAERVPLDAADASYELLNLGTVAEYEAVLTTLARANSSLSDQDKEILVFLIQTLPHAEKLLPAVISQRETLAVVLATLLQKDPAYRFSDRIGTATDVLRVAVQLSGGDVSLAENTRFGKFPRSIRRALLAALESCGPSLEEDMLRYSGKWIRLGEILHPGQYRIFPRALAAFTKLRNGVPIPTFNSRAEALLGEGASWQDAVAALHGRPGEFLRRLDHLLRTHGSHSAEILHEFFSVADRCTTSALLNLAHHFRNRPVQPATRVVFPKGSTAKMKVIPGFENQLPEALRTDAARGIETVLRTRFADLSPLGKVYIDPALEKCPVPFAQRSDSRALRTLPKGCRVPLDDGEAREVLRFFVYWKNGKSRTDVDLSCAFLKEDFSLAARVAYYNLREVGGTHSGDIVDAPQGASEFIDVEISKLLATGARYVAAVIFSYSGQSLRSLPECFFGWMTRNHSQHGEIFEPKTVRSKADLAGETGCSVPVVMDLKAREVIWCDIATRGHPAFPANLDNNKASLALVCRHLVTLNKPTLHHLLSLHATARGEIVQSREEADTIFGESFVYEGNLVAAEYLDSASNKNAEAKGFDAESMSAEIGLT